MTRKRLRDIGIIIGEQPTGLYNAITDVPGVLVGHATLIYDEPHVARTGVTMILPRGGTIRRNYAFAGFHRFNGCGEMTGLPWIEESGMLTSPIALTNTNQVGLVRDAIIEYTVTQYERTTFDLNVVAETWDGWLNGIDAFHITKEHVFDAMAAAKSGIVAEGNVGGGTGMICHDFKGGTGTASRLVDSKSGRFVVGVLVQTNYGDRAQLRVDGVPVGREIGSDKVPIPWEEPPNGGSIIVIVATDAPLLPLQCKRLAQRATVGLARVGGIGQNNSGDLFLAFSTGNQMPVRPKGPLDLLMIPHHHLNPFFQAVAEATEEAILNALTAAQTMTGYRGRTVHALPLEELEQIMAKYRPQK